MPRGGGGSADLADRPRGPYPRGRQIHVPTTLSPFQPARPHSSVIVFGLLCWQACLSTADDNSIHCLFSANPRHCLGLAYPKRPLTHSINQSTQLNSTQSILIYHRRVSFRLLTRTRRRRRPSTGALSLSCFQFSQIPANPPAFCPSHIALMLLRARI